MHAFLCIIIMEKKKISRKTEQLVYWKQSRMWVCVCAWVSTPSCLTLCDPMDCIPLGSSVRGILQGRILEWVAIPSPEDLPDPGIEFRSPALQADSLPFEPLGKPPKSSNSYILVSLSYKTWISNRLQVKIIDTKVKYGAFYFVNMAPCFHLLNFLRVITVSHHYLLCMN